MKHHLIAILGLLISCLLVGCGSLSNSNVQATPLDGWLYIAAGAGTMEAIEGHPERRAKFEAAAASLEKLAASTNALTSVLLIETLSPLPIKEFKSKHGRFFMLATGGLAYQSGFTTDPLSIIPVPASPSTARALAAGIRQGLMLSP